MLTHYNQLLFELRQAGVSVNKENDEFGSAWVARFEGESIASHARMVECIDLAYQMFGGK